MTDGSGEWEETLARGVEDNAGHDRIINYKFPPFFVQRVQRPQVDRESPNSALQQPYKVFSLSKTDRSRAPIELCLSWGLVL